MSVNRIFHNMMDFSPQVYRLLAAAGVTKIRELAEIIDEKPNVISNWNSRKRIPANKVLKCSQIVGISPTWLQTGEGEMRPDKPQDTEGQFSALISEEPGAYNAEPINISRWEAQLLKLLRSCPPETQQSIFDKAIAGAISKKETENLKGNGRQE